MSTGPNHGAVIISQPAGGPVDEDNFVSRCIEVRHEGTDYTNFEKMSMNPLTMNHRRSRILQAADLVVSISTAYVAGSPIYPKPHFDRFKEKFRRGGHSQYGGAGLKIHPDYSYKNLYHWLLGDEYFYSGSMGTPYPLSSRPYRESADRY